MNKSLSENKTLLADHPFWIISVVVFLFVLTESFSGFIEALIQAKNCISVLVIHSIPFAGLIFVLLPRILRFGEGKSVFFPYLTAIGLKPCRRPDQLLFITLSCYFFFILSQLCGALIYHASVSQHFILDFSRHSLLDSHSIISGFVEEVVFRGISIPILLNRFSAKKTVFISAGLFAGLHLFNLFHPHFVFAWVLCQVGWAFGLGCLYGTLFIKFKSLWPAIFLHYLINAFVGVWFSGLDTQSLTSGLYGLLFFGTLPTLISMGWVNFLFGSWKRKNGPAGNL